MDNEVKKYDEWLSHQLVNLVEALLQHNSNLLEKSLNNIEHSLNFTEDISPRLIDLAIKFRTLLRLYRTEKKPIPGSSWGWLYARSGSSPAIGSDTVDLTELKSVLNKKRQINKEEQEKKKEQIIQKLAGSIKELRGSDEE
ncbi:MAG: hypothetical protein ACE5R6_03080 [Candidatus Heimdallarchaeota archaeon]